MITPAQFVRQNAAVDGEKRCKSRTLAVGLLYRKSKHTNQKVAESPRQSWPQSPRRFRPAMAQLKIDVCKSTKYQESIENSYALIHYLIVQMTNVHTIIEMYFLSCLQAMRLVHVSVVSWKLVSTTLQQLPGGMMIAATFFLSVHV